jgi:pimeloyl-ACP methyl ester carboxylesterase
VLREVGLGPAVAFGASSGGCSSLALAATTPDLVSHLVLYGAYLDGAAITTPELRASLESLVEAHWGIGSQVLADLVMPDAAQEGARRLRALPAARGHAGYRRPELRDRPSPRRHPLGRRRRRPDARDPPPRGPCDPGRARERAAVTHTGTPG